MYLPRIIGIAYFFTLGYLAHKNQVPQKISAVVNSVIDDLNRRTARAFFDEADKRQIVSLKDISG